METEYARRLQARMASMPGRANPFTNRDLEGATGYSFEHIRKVLHGLPVVSEALNRTLCQVLKLDAGEMWAVAKAEKLQRKARELGMDAVPTADERISGAWPLLFPEERDVLCRMIESLVANRQPRQPRLSGRRGPRQRAQKASKKGRR